MTDDNEALREAHATILELRAEKAAREQSRSLLADLKAKSIELAKLERITEAAARVIGPNLQPSPEPELAWARIEREGEQAARRQAELLEGLSWQEILQELKRQQQRSVVASRSRERRRRQKRRR